MPGITPELQQLLYPYDTVLSNGLNYVNLKN